MQSESSTVYTNGNPDRYLKLGGKTLRICIILEQT